ncbi:16S rRNA (cytosine(1402)-N(4))-methyltransferase RsmH [Deferrisoma palaeochoriense]
MTRPDGGYHVPVLAREAADLLVTDPDGLYVDGTLGGGGHAREILARLGPGGRLLGLDRDPDALAHAAAWAGDPRVLLRRANFAELSEVLEAEGLGPVTGVLLDLGVSSHQVDEGERGFSFLRDGPLDMRMDPEGPVTAADLVNTLDEAELARIFREYGEEPRASRAARAVVTARRKAPLRTTADLARTIEEALGRRGPKHPATRIFQALRIAVNRELEALDRFLEALPGVLAPGGRVVVISYHSLEDRRVKRALRAGEPQCRCPPEALRCTCGRPGWLRVLTRKVVRPSAEEVARNPRARSARLRAAERLVPDRGQGGQ